MTTFLQDVKYAARNLRQTRGFAVVVILTLALGIGTNTAIFSIVYSVVLRPLSYPEPQQLVRITSELRAVGATDTGTAALELFDYQALTDLFSGVAGLYPINANVTGGDKPERVEVMLGSWNYFSILGATPQLGRVFTPDDNGPGIPEVAVASDGYWRRRLGGDPDAIGKTLLVDGDPFVLIGVMPPTFHHPGRTVESEVDLWCPAGYRALPFPEPDRGRRFLNGALARLQPGVSVARAQASLDVYADQTRRAFPADYPERSGWHPLIVPLQEDVVGSVTTAMLILLSAVGLVLLIACANVANLILARASERQRDMALRQALGASWARLTRLLLAESALLAAAGGVLGLLLAASGVRLLVALAPSRVPRLGDAGLDGMAVAVTVLLAIVTTVVFGLAPAWQMRRLDAFGVLKESGPGRSAGPGRSRVRHLLVSGEVALAMVLLIGAGLLTRSFWQLQQVPLGFKTDNLVTARVWLPRPNDPANGVYLDPKNRVAFYREAIRRVGALPEVARVAMSNQIPMGGFNPPIFFEIEGRQDSASDGRLLIHGFQVSPSYFETLGVPLQRGRTFTGFDRADTDPVVIVSAAAARTFWRNEDPIGKRIRFGPRAPWMTVVGVVGDVLNRRLEEAPQPILYRSLEQSSNLALSLLIRTRGSAPNLTEAVSREVREVDPNLPVYAVRTMDDMLARALAQRQFLMRVLVAFGAAAIGLALLGLYGVISYSVSQRTREIGIRMAIGARGTDVVRMIVRQGMTLTGIGMILGTAGALGLSHLIESQLFGVQPSDLRTLGSVVALVALVALAAAYLPARRAARVDPLTALRQD